MATAAIQTQPEIPSGHFEPIIKNTAPAWKHDDTVFNANEHLVTSGAPSRIMMKDIGFPEDRGVSPFAVCQPFKMFSDTAIEAMRAEVFKPEVLKGHQWNSNLAACQIRGYSAKCAPFIHDAWNHPKTLELVSKIAGVDLIPTMNFEVGHVNISVKSEQDARDELDMVDRKKQFFASDEGIAGCPWEDDKPVVGWHTDSYPFVCVLMLSDCTNMVGGETALQTGTGEILKVRGPEKGCAVVMQGRYITHQALRAMGAQERITMVTSFRPKSPHLKDDSVLSTTRAVSDLSELYYQFAEYRLAVLEERIRAELKSLRDAHEASRQTDVRSLKAFLEIQESFLRQTNHEIIEPGLVRSGSIDNPIDHDEGTNLRTA